MFKYFYQGFWVIGGIYKTIKFYDACVYWFDEWINGRKPTFPHLGWDGYWVVVSRK